jgi:hypothetical protein
MKYIITESQHKKLQMRQWLLRRYDLVMSEYKESVVEMNPCNFNNCEDYINRVVTFIMDGLHHEYYLNDNFDYKGMELTILDMFYVELTESCYSKRQKCRDNNERYPMTY